MIKNSLFFCLFFFSFNAFSHSALKYFSGTKHYYKRYDISMSWDAAKSFCEKKGGYIAVPNSLEENNFIFNLAAEKTDSTFLTWLGGWSNKRDVLNKPIYQWITGESMSFKNIDPNDSTPGHGVSGETMYMLLNNGSIGFNSQHYWSGGSQLNNFVMVFINHSGTNFKTATICELTL